MHKLTSLEAQRVVSVLDSTISSLTLLSYLPSSSSGSAVASPEGGEAKGGECTELYRRLEEENCLEVKQGVERVLGAEREVEAGGRSLGGGSESSTALQRSTLHLLRLLRSHPHSSDILLSAPTSRDPASLRLIDDLSALAGIAFRKLSTTVEEEATNELTLRELTDRSKSAEKDRDSLQQNLGFQRAEKDREVASLGQQISKLRAELNDCERSNRMEVEGIEASARTGVEKARAEHTEKVSALEQDIEKRKEKMLKWRGDHKDTEAGLRKRKAKLETDLKMLIRKYDTDMGEKQAAIEALEDKFKRESEELRELQEHFDKVDADAATSVKEDKMLQEVEEMEKAARFILDEACKVMQKRVRGIAGRVEVAKLKKKKGGKGKKGKKGKK